jgi:hypothetical protein
VTAPLRQDLDESLVIRNKTDNADVVQISKSGDVKLLAADGGIVFPDGSRQTTAAQIVVEETNTPNSVVERDSHGDISVNNANLQSNLQLPISGYIATPDAIDQNVRVIPKLFLSAGGGPSSGVIPSLTFRSTNPSHMFGEVAFQDNTPSPGQDIWAMQQDFLMNHTESLTFRRRGQEVMQFFPLGPQGSNVLTTFSGTRIRFERSGPYPIEFRDTSFAAPNGLWRMFTSQDCWFLDKNTAVAGDFSSHNPVLQTCADGTLVTPGLRINSVLVSNNDLSVSSGGNIMLTSAPGRNIRFNSGAANLFNAPIAVGTSTPLAKIHVASGGNLQEAIFESLFNANEGVSIRNSAQNWALGVRADLGQAFNLRSITTGVDAMLLTPAGAVTLPNGQLTAAKGVSVGKSVDGNGSGLKHGRVAVPSVAAGANLTVELVWKTAFADASYTPTCNAVSDGAGTAALRLHHLQTVLPNKVVAVLINDDSAQAHTGSLDCMAMHD